MPVKKIFKLLFIFGVILLISAVLAPVLFKVLPFKFERIFNRLVMIQTILAALLFVRVRKDALSHYGLRWSPGELPLLGRGFAGGLVMMGVVAVFALKAGPASFSMPGYTVPVWLSRLTKALASGLVIGVIEEFFFRGFVFRSLQGRLRWPVWLAFIVTSVFYSLVHFLSDRAPFIGPNPTFRDGVKLALAPLGVVPAFPKIWEAALGLFIFGLILNDLSFRTKSLYPAIGLHAGCVFFIKMDGNFLDFPGGHDLILGSSLLYDGILGWCVLALFFGVFRFVIKGPQRNSIAAGVFR